MSTTEATLTPPVFEDWLDQEGATPARDRRDCQAGYDGCRGDADWLALDVCDVCARRFHAEYVAEEQKVRGMLAALNPAAWQTILDLQEMHVDSRLPELVELFCRQLLADHEETGR